MIRRTFDAARINELVNHPSVRPHIGGDPEQPLDLSAAVSDRTNVFLLGEHGGFACCWTAPRTYEIHTFVLPDGRGRWAYQLAQHGRDWMADYGALHLWTRVHPEAENVRRFTLAAGFVPAGTHTIDIGTGPVTYDLFDWRHECQQR